MKNLSYILILVLVSTSFAQDFNITEVLVEKNDSEQMLSFNIVVEGLAGDSTPTLNGALDGASVLGYVFPTTLNTYDVGFDTTSGIVALALTSHPDFDDTPLWDENNDAIYDNDGVYWHPHWVVLSSDDRVPGGLSVKATSAETTLPPTNPGMPMYMDSPGFQVITKGHKISCSVPYYRINHQTDFMYDGVAAKMIVNTSLSDKPMLGVYEVYSLASGDLSLPYEVETARCDTLYLNAAITTNIDPLSEPLKIYPNPAKTSFTVENPSKEAVSIEIYSIAGVEVYAETISEDVEISTQTLGGTGVYLMRSKTASDELIDEIKILVE